MDDVRKDMAQHVKDICWMNLEVSQMQGKAALKSHDPEGSGHDQLAYPGGQGGEE